MEDVFLHWRLDPPAGLPSLLRTAQNLLEPFPCRTAPVFTPWFPSARHLPLRPARPPPTITSVGAEPEGEPSPLRPAGPPPTEPPANEGAEPEEQRQTEPIPPDRPPTRSWITANPSPVPSHGDKTSAMSKRLRNMLAVHKLHPLQRAHWVIRQQNCGARTTLEQMWRALCRTLRTAPLPSCTATIRRDRAEVWVFCNLERAEHVGRRLKGALQLHGSIRLCVRTLPNLLSL